MMERYATLLEQLALTPQRNGKLRLLTTYFAQEPDPDRGYGMASLAGDLDLPSIKPAMLRALTAKRVDETLFALSYDFVGDLAETIALIWPAKHGINSTVPSLSGVVETLQSAKRSEAPDHIENWLDVASSGARFALLKLVTGGMRVGVSARLVKQALADYGQKDITDIEELWHGLSPPYHDLFDWLEGKAPKPVNAMHAPFRPVMLAHPLDDNKPPEITPNQYAVEWKWDGIRVQAVCDHGVKRLYTRTGDDISDAFPDLANALSEEATLDGELLIGRQTDHGVEIGSFGDLQQRLNRKRVSAKQMADMPAFMRCYDCLMAGNEDLRALPFNVRRQRLEDVVAKLPADRFDVSQSITFNSFDDLAQARANPPEPIIEGLMIKNRNSAYLTGRVKGHWYKWKRDPFIIDAVMLYAQRGHGKRSSFYSDFTFGVWAEDEHGALSLVPVGKAYSGFTDEELKRLDKFVRDNTIDRFGPVRSVTATQEKGLVLEVAFEGLNRSKRHKSGVAMRFPRISRIRWDKPSRDADHLQTLEAMLPEDAI